MIGRRSFIEALAATAAGLVLPESKRVRAYSFAPACGWPRDVWMVTRTTSTFPMCVYAIEGAPFILGNGQAVEIGDMVAIDPRDPSRVYAVPRVHA